MDTETFSVPTRRGLGYVNFRVNYDLERLMVSFPVRHEVAVLRFPLHIERWNRHERAKWRRVASLLPPTFRLLSRLREELTAEV